MALNAEDTVQLNLDVSASGFNEILSAARRWFVSMVTCSCTTVLCQDEMRINPKSATKPHNIK